MDQRITGLTRKMLGEFIKSPETVRAFENLSLNSDDYATVITGLQNSAVLTLSLSDGFVNERVLASDGNISLTDGGPGQNATLGLSNTGVTAGNYGSATQLVRLAIDAKGRVSLAQTFTLNSDNVTEGGANLFFTQARARAALSAGAGIDYDNTTGVIKVHEQLASGTYTPTVTAILNLDATTAYVCQYMRVGNVVTVSGKVDANPTAAGSTELDISLPIASNFVTDYQCGGTAAAAGVAGQSAAILSATSKARMSWIAVDTTNRQMRFTFTYQILP